MFSKVFRWNFFCYLGQHLVGCNVSPTHSCRPDHSPPRAERNGPDENPVTRPDRHDGRQDSPCPDCAGGFLTTEEQIKIFDFVKETRRMVVSGRSPTLSIFNERGDISASFTLHLSTIGTCVVSVSVLSPVRGWDEDRGISLPWTSSLPPLLRRRTSGKSPSAPFRAELDLTRRPLTAPSFRASGPVTPSCASTCVLSSGCVEFYACT